MLTKKELDSLGFKPWKALVDVGGDGTVGGQVYLDDDMVIWTQEGLDADSPLLVQVEYAKRTAGSAEVLSAKDIEKINGKRDKKDKAS